MIISHVYKFIFIKTRKTAGTSIEVFLSGCCGARDVVTPIQPEVEGHQPRNYTGLWNPLPELVDNRGRGLVGTLRDLARRNRYYNHIPARLVRDRTPDWIWRSYFKFCVERNPWDKTLSHYHMVNDRAGGAIDFDEYLLQATLATDYAMYTDRAGRPIVDRVARYEDLSSELTEIFGRLGVPFDGTLGVRAKSKHRNDRRPYQEVYTDAQRQLVQEAFAREIGVHGYTF